MSGSVSDLVEHRKCAMAHLCPAVSVPHVRRNRSSRTTALYIERNQLAALDGVSQQMNMHFSRTENSALVSNLSEI